MVEKICGIGEFWAWNETVNVWWRVTVVSRWEVNYRVWHHQQGVLCKAGGMRQEVDCRDEWLWAAEKLRHNEVVRCWPGCGETAWLGRAAAPRVCEASLPSRVWDSCCARSRDARRRCSPRGETDLLCHIQTNFDEIFTVDYHAAGLNGTANDFYSNLLCVYNIFNSFT